MRIVIDAAGGVGDADGLQELDGLGAAFLAGKGAVDADRLGQLVADAVERVERRLRVLEDIGDLAASEAAQLAVGRADQILAPVMDRAAGDETGRRGDEAHDAERGDGFPRAAFAYDAETFAGLDREGHAAHGAVDAVLDVELRLQVVERQDAVVPLGFGLARGGHQRGGQRAVQRAGFQAGVERVADAVAEQVDRHDDDQDHHAGHDGGVGVGDQRRARLAQHGAEIGDRRLRPEAEEGEARGFEDHPAHGRGHGDDDDGQDVGQDLGQDDAGVGHAREAGGIDEFLVRDADGYPPDIAREEGDVDGGHRDQRVHQAGTEGRDDGECEQDVGKGHEHVDAAHDDVVGAPAVIARDDAYGGPDGGGDEGGGETHGKRQAGAPHQAGEQIAAKVVGAEDRPLGKGRKEAVPGVGDVGRFQRQEGRQDRQENDYSHDDQAAERQPVAGEKRQEAHVLILGSRRLWATSTTMLNRT